MARASWTDARSGRATTGNSRFHLRQQLRQLRDLGPKDYLRWHGILANAWVLERLNRRHYAAQTEQELRATRRSDKVFIFGSGYSLKDITPAEWRNFEEHDTFGFSGFVHQRWVRTDYHLIRGWAETPEGTFNWRRSTEDFSRVLTENPRFRDTIFIVQGEYLASFCNRLLGYRLLPSGARIYRFRTAREPGPPTRSLKQGVRHMAGTLSDAVNVAYCLGWKEIVLVGVDLYDSRYFWLGADETLNLEQGTGRVIPAEVSARGLRYNHPHNTVRSGIVDILGQWRRDLEALGTSLTVYNRLSLLANVMPVYDGPRATERPRM